MPVLPRILPTPRPTAAPAASQPRSAALRGVLLALLSLSLAGCGTTFGDPDQGVDGGDPASAVDQGTTETAIPDGAETDAPECPGGLFCPCLLFSDCRTGICVDTIEGPLCSLGCGMGEACPGGWLCKTVSVSGEATYGCVPESPNLCRPCIDDEDCAPASGDDDRPRLCLDRGEDGRFCGAPCQTDADCPDRPEAFRCQVVASTAGDVGQCVPADGSCPCTEKFASGGFLTECQVHSPAGTCHGHRTCAVPCDAPTPKAEECNLIDDNCDGDTDEGVGRVACLVENPIGKCPGTAECISGAPGPCEGLAAVDESCNGLDDNCDGDTDEGFADTDLDGQADCEDPDLDGDGIPNGDDDCPFVKNADQRNNDQALEDPTARRGDACDDDDDDDGIPDTADVCPLVPDPLQLDGDGDGKGDLCDCDADDDGRPNAAGLDLLGAACPAPGAAADNCPTVKNADQLDTDGDHQGDACDCDVDDDGKPNNNPGCPITPVPDNCRSVQNPLQEDLDRDGIGDACDCDVDDDGVTNPNPGCPAGDDDNCPTLKNTDQADADLDGQGDACDCDADDDGVTNPNPGCPACGPCDNCPLVANPGQENTTGLPIGDACNDDLDRDGIPKKTDNCPNVANPKQENSDLDDSGDACDCDIDGDGYANTGVDRDGKACPTPAPADNCPLIANPSQANFDKDTFGDACDCDIDNDGHPQPAFGCPTPVPQDCAPFDPLVWTGC